MHTVRIYQLTAPVRLEKNGATSSRRLTRLIDSVGKFWCAAWFTKGVSREEQGAEGGV